MASPKRRYYTHNEPHSVPLAHDDPAEPVDENTLLERSISGDKEAFGRLFEKYRHIVYRRSRRLLDNRDDAEDATQETFMKAYRGIGNFRDGSSFYTWLYRINFNVIMDNSRRTQTSPQTTPFDSLFKETEDQPTSDIDASKILIASDNSPNPERGVYGMEISKKIAEAIKLLTLKERVVFELRHYSGYKVRDIVPITGYSNSHVRRILWKATKKIRENMGEYYGMPPGASYKKPEHAEHKGTQNVVSRTSSFTFATPSYETAMQHAAGHNAS